MYRALAVISPPRIHEAFPRCAHAKFIKKNSPSGSSVRSDGPSNRDDEAEGRHRIDCGSVPSHLPHPSHGLPFKDWPPTLGTRPTTSLAVLSWVSLAILQGPSWDSQPLGTLVRVRAQGLAPNCENQPQKQKRVHGTEDHPEGPRMGMSRWLQQGPPQGPESEPGRSN